MELQGRVQNGVIVVDGHAVLPEGAQVTVVLPTIAGSDASKVKQRLQFPLVHSDHPGTLNLTGRQVEQILNDEDLSA